MTKQQEGGGRNGYLIGGLVGFAIGTIFQRLILENGLRNQDIQKKINDLALEANAKRYKAYKLEQEALRIMNEEVIFVK